MVNAYAAEHLEIQTATRPTWPHGSGRPARSSSARGRRSASATTAPAPTTCCPPRAARGTPAGLSVQTFLRGIHVVDYTEAALKDVSGHVITLANAEDLPAHGEAVRRRFEALK